MTKSTLTEIDRLEGIAQAYARRRPIVPMQGVLADADWARKLVETAATYELEMNDLNSEMGALQDELRVVHTEIAAAKSKWISAQEQHALVIADLDNLMASLSARLER